MLNMSTLNLWLRFQFKSRCKPHSPPFRIRTNLLAALLSCLRIALSMLNQLHLSFPTRIVLPLKWGPLRLLVRVILQAWPKSNSKQCTSRCFGSSRWFSKCNSSYTGNNSLHRDIKFLNDMIILISDLINVKKLYVIIPIKYLFYPSNL